MTTTRRSLLCLPPEILLNISQSLPLDALLSMKSTHTVLDATLPRTQRCKATTPPSPLLSLPPELIYEIADHLPPDAILALKFTHPILNDTLLLAPRLKNTALSSCARLAIRAHLSKPVTNPSHMRCILCKAVYPLAIFSSSSSPACVPLPLTNDGPPPEVVELPQRFCAWHVGRLAKIIHTERGGRNEWVSAIREMCMHCGSVRGWGECNCRCDSCGCRSVRTYTRYLNNSMECRRFLFVRDTAKTDTYSAPEKTEGQLYVRETCWDPSTFHHCQPCRGQGNAQVACAL